jgi:hypothetical protein
VGLSGLASLSVNFRHPPRLCRSPSANSVAAERRVAMPLIHSAYRPRNAHAHLAFRGGCIAMSSRRSLRKMLGLYERELNRPPEQVGEDRCRRHTGGGTQARARGEWFEPLTKIFPVKRARSLWRSNSVSLPLIGHVTRGKNNGCRDMIKTLSQSKAALSRCNSVSFMQAL